MTRVFLRKIICQFVAVCIGLLCCGLDIYPVFGWLL